MAHRRFFLLILLGLSVGCGNLKRKSEQHEKVTANEKEVAELSQKEIVEAYKNFDLKMQSMVKKAKSDGKSSIDYLASDLFLKANDAAMRGDSHTASYLFKYLLSLEPKNQFIRKKYAVELIRMGSLEEAKEVLSSLLKESQFESESLGLILGGTYTALNQADKAEAVYQKVLNKHPGSEEACVFLAKSFSAKKSYKRSIELLNSCEKKSPKSPVFAFYKGKIYLLEKKEQQAINAFKSSLKKDGDYYQSVLALGLIKEEKEDYKGALVQYKNFLKKNPNSYPVLSRVVQIMFAHEMFQEVIPYAETLSSLDTSDLNLKVRLGILYTDNEQFDDAIGIFKEILSAVPNSDKVLYYLATLYQQTNDPVKALETFNKISDESSLYIDSSLQIAQILQVLAQADSLKWSRPYQDFLSQRGGKVDDLKVEFKMMLATFYEGKFEYGKAIEAMEGIRQEKLYSESHDFYLASLYEKIQNFSQARNIVQKMLDKNPENPHALNFLGYSLLENNENFDEAYNLIAKAVKISPNDGYIRDSLGWFYYKTGELQKALIEIKKAWNLVKTDVVISKHLAIIYRELKNMDQARFYFVEALKNCKYESERQDVIKAIGDMEGLRLPASSP